MGEKQNFAALPSFSLGRTPSSVFSTPENQSTQQLRLRRTSLIPDRPIRPGGWVDLQSHPRRQPGRSAEQHRV